MSTDKMPPDPINRGRALVRHEIRHDKRIYTLDLSAEDKQIVVKLEGFNKDSELISHLVGELSLEDLEIVTKIIHVMGHSLVTMGTPQAEAKAYAVTDKRLSHRDAYARWSIEQDDLLRQRYRDGATLSISYPASLVEMWVESGLASETW